MGSQDRRFVSSKSELFEVVVRVLMDSSRKTSDLTRADRAVDAGYLLGHTVDNDNEPLLELSNAWLERNVRRVLLEDIGAHNLSVGSSVAGFENWRNRLLAMGVREDAIIAVPPALDLLPPCTDSEVIGLVRLAKERGWKTVHLFAPALHRFRAFVSTVSAIKRVGYDLQVWGQPITSVQNWQEVVVYSQSAPKAARKSQVVDELAKVEQYCAKGDHVTAKEVLEYLDWRDLQ